MNFTEEQLRAIDIARLGEDACIVAGPGSGKTTVLVERYRQLVASGIEPSEILAITYTEKAAANMRSRLAREFAGDPAMLSKLERSQVSTIHGFCNRLLKENATAAGVDPEFEILDEQIAVLEQARALREALDAVLREHPAGMDRLLSVTRGADLESLIPPIYDAMRSAGVRPAALALYPVPAAPSLDVIAAVVTQYLKGFGAILTPAQNTARGNTAGWLERVTGESDPLKRAALLEKPDFNLRVKNAVPNEEMQRVRAAAAQLAGSLLDEAFAGEKALLVAILERFDELYRFRKFTFARLDFNDLEFYSVRLLRDNPAVKRQVNDQFRLVMIDEFQDTSGQQSELVSLIHGPGRFYAVGDLNQSIYSFRHASPLVFLRHQESVVAANGHSEELVENWRSREPVLLATQFVLKEADGITKRDLVPARCLPDKSEPSIEILVSDMDEDEDYAAEAQTITTRILELHRELRIGEEKRPARLRDFAILVRNTGVLSAFTAAFDRAGVAYNLNRRSGFFETREARELTHLLRMIYNPQDEPSTLAVLRSDLAGLSDESLLRLKLHRQSFGEALAQAEAIALPSEDRERLTRFTTAFYGWRRAANYTAIDRLVLRALDEMGIRWNPASLAGANIEKFIGIARAYSSMTLGEFVAHLEALRRADPKEQDSPIDETRDAVQMMSTHAAKGLEFPVVILATLDKGINESGSSSGALNFTPEHGLGVQWTTKQEGGPCSGVVHLLNKERIEKTESDESNRLLYVAMTRAEEHLVLSWSRKSKGKPGNWAKLVANTFAIDPAESGMPAVREFEAPNGKPFSVRVSASQPSTAAEAFFTARTEAPEQAVIEPPEWMPEWEPVTTATALSRFAVCPRKFYLGNYLGWGGDLVRARPSQRGAPESRASEIGTEVHALLAGAQLERTGLESIQLAQVFDRSPLGKRARKARRRETEWDFTFAFEDLIIRGTIDLWFEDANGITLVDYKTDEVDAAGAAIRAGDYALQLQVYALALEQALGQAPQQAWLHFLKPDTVVPVPLADAASEVRYFVRDYVHAQQNQAFRLVPGLHCRRCEFFRGICPARLLTVPE